jgi:transcription initiation protein SPT3 homolog
MTRGQYFRYSEARRANFANKARPNKFKDWLFKDYLQEIKLNTYALEILQYLAYETVAQVSSHYWFP